MNKRSRLTKAGCHTYLLGSSKGASPEGQARRDFGRSTRATGADATASAEVRFEEGAQPSTSQPGTSVSGGPIGRDGYAGSRQDTFRASRGKPRVVRQNREDASRPDANPERARLRPSFLGVSPFLGHRVRTPRVGSVWWTARGCWDASSPTGGSQLEEIQTVAHRADQVGSVRVADGHSVPAERL